MNYGPLLRATRESSGLTQEEMGEELGVSRTVITKMEQGKVGLQMDRGLDWFRITETQKVVEMLAVGVDVTVIIDSLTTITGGFMLWM